MTLNDIHYNLATATLFRGTNCTHGNSSRLFEDLTTNNYKGIVDEEFQYFLKFQLRSTYAWNQSGLIK
jgi:hypothetical protein